MAAALQTPPAAGENVVLAGLVRALVQPQILRLDQAVAIQRMAEQERQDGHLFIGELIRSGTVSARQVAKFAAETRMIALMRRGNRLSVAMSDPTDLPSIDRVKFQTQSQVDPIIVEHDRLRALAEKRGQDSAEKLSDMIGDVSDVEVSSDEQVAQT